MKTLLLDTAHRKGFVAIGDDEQLIAIHHLDPEIPHSEAAACEVDRLLMEAQIERLDRIFVGVGPGSYTGLRVALSIATGLHVATNVPLHPFCSLLPYRSGATPFMSLFDARAGGVYALHSEEKEPRRLPLEELSKQDVKIFVGPDMGLINERLTLPAPYEESGPDLQYLLEQDLKAGPIRPLYLKNMVPPSMVAGQNERKE